MYWLQWHVDCFCGNSNTGAVRRDHMHFVFLCVFVSKEHSSHRSWTHGCQEVLPVFWRAQQKGHVYNIYHPHQRLQGTFKYASGGEYLKTFVFTKIVFLRYWVNYLICCEGILLISKIKTALVAYLEVSKHILGISFLWIPKVLNPRGHSPVRKPLWVCKLERENAIDRHQRALLCRKNDNLVAKQRNYWLKNTQGPCYYSWYVFKYKSIF